MSQEELKYSIWVRPEARKNKKGPWPRIPRITAADIAEHGVSWPQLSQEIVKRSQRKRRKK